MSERSSKDIKKDIIDVQMLGCDKKIRWEMTQEGLQVGLPACKPNNNGYVLKITRK